MGEPRRVMRSEGVGWGVLRRVFWEKRVGARKMEITGGVGVFVVFEKGQQAFKARVALGVGP